MNMKERHIIQISHRFWKTVSCSVTFICVWYLVMTFNISREWENECSMIPEVRPVLVGKDCDSFFPQAFFLLVVSGTFPSWKVVLCGLQLMASFLSSAHLALSGAKPAFCFISLLPLSKVFRTEKSCRYNCKGVPFLNWAQYCRGLPCFGCGYKHFPQSSWQVQCGCSGKQRRWLYLLLAPFARCQPSTWRCVCPFLHFCSSGKSTGWLFSVATQLLVSQSRQHIVAGERKVYLSEVWK